MADYNPNQKPTGATPSMWSNPTNLVISGLVILVMGGVLYAMTAAPDRTNIVQRDTTSATKPIVVEKTVPAPKN